MIGFGYMRLYSWLYLRHGLREFTLDEISDKAGELGLKTPVNVLLQRLLRKGLVERVSRGRYRAVHPHALLLESLGYGWRERIEGDYRPLLEYVVSSMIERFRERLVSIVLFGSLARGTERRYSDIDLLVVAEGIPSSYGERVKMISRVLEGAGEIRYRLWVERGLYPLVDVILLSREEAMMNHPFYLDLAEDAIVIYDRDSFMRRRIEEVRGRLAELGSRRVQLPDGRYYWVLKPSARWGEAIEI